MSNKPKISVIGAANIDLIGFSQEKLIFKDSNIGNLETVLGGVGRNISENIKRLGFDVEFLSVFADDEFSKTLISSCKELGISIDHSLYLKDKKTSMFVAIMNHFNDLALGLSAMEIYDDLPSSFILDNLDAIKESDYCIIETNLPEFILDLVTRELPDTRFALEAVSAKKALKGKSILNRLDILKCNHIEAELLSDIKIEYENDYEKVIEHFLNLGVKKVFITLGKDGVAYGDKNEIFIHKNKTIVPVNTNGAGDAFMAGLVYSEIKEYNLYDMVNYASACAQITIQHKNAVHPEISEQMVKNTLAL
ncbi:PfkB family carbohydrate kinase [Ichthyenterobacterium magnum]|uniref:Pseudouridine kinase n=1 Tax=Ichthyenterobacterium magnum TaxID=1230530 RepID=A0A420DMB4_9FLAO|nr:PfkB family carbohydrate kinase [Ichthyenterobacterium magnum]RKE95383.1 pseudouridine kinase [Ichthyenterobacterium magnum]